MKARIATPNDLRHRVDVDLSTKKALLYLAYSTGRTVKDLVRSMILDYMDRRLPSNWKEVMANDEDFQQDVGKRTKGSRE